MAENKTKPTADDVLAFLAAVEPEARRQDAIAVCEMMSRISGEPPVLWGPSIVGFGRYHYRYASGHEGDAMLVGFSPRKAALTLYVLSDLPGQADLMSRLGQHTIGKSCLYLKRLADVDLEVLEALVTQSYRHMRATHVAA